MASSSRAALFVVAFLCAVGLGCSNKGKTSVGSHVQAPWSTAQTMYPGTITELYGKLAHIDFDDGDRGWADVTLLKPRGTPRPTPSDSCRFATGARVKAPWGRHKTMYAGKVIETHGKLAHIAFDDGDENWSSCSETEAAINEPLKLPSTRAPWSRSKAMYPGRVTRTYGKLAHIDFDDGGQGWALLESLDPPRSAEARPTGSCAFEVGERVTAPWSRAKTLYPGRISEVYGRLGLVDFDDGDQGWCECEELKR